ncbi:MAG: hypothetical protein AB8G16_06020 [Gammaproteobacteria bacterium]
MNRALFSGGMIISLLSVAPLCAAQSTGLAIAAIDDHKGVSLHNWRFDRLRDVGKKKIRERCKGVDFRKAECRLLEVDGAPPDEKALERYAKSTSQPVEDNLPNIDPGEFVNSATLNVTERGDVFQSFSFDGAADSDDEYEEMGRQKGVMQVHLDDGHIQSLRLKNSTVFKPATGIKIKKLEISIDFVRVDEAVFASSVSMVAEGKAFGLKSIGENQHFEFKNFTPPQ